MQQITFRLAGEDDVKLIKNISWQTFFDTFHPFNSKEDMELFLTTNFTEEIVRNEIKDKQNTFVLAYLKKQVAGYVKLSQGKAPRELTASNTIEISRLYALKEKIGTGVGKALMERCIRFAEEKNKDVIWLGVWEHNQRAIQFYRRCGFEKFGEQLFMLGHDKQNDWLMKKELGAALS
jgi:ribosomal protein S18 acetylase RimI-like enzyme